MIKAIISGPELPILFETCSGQGGKIPG